VIIGNARIYVLALANGELGCVKVGVVAVAWVISAVNAVFAYGKVRET